MFKHGTLYLVSVYSAFVSGLCTGHHTGALVAQPSLGFSLFPITLLEIRSSLAKPSQPGQPLSAHWYDGGMPTSSRVYSLTCHLHRGFGAKRQPESGLFLLTFSICPGCIAGIPLTLPGPPLPKAVMREQRLSRTRSSQRCLMGRTEEINPRY